MLKVQLSRNLRKNILQGHPWVYREALQATPSKEKAQLCQLLDSKKKPLAWAIYDSKSPLALRILSTEKRPPDEVFFTKRFENAKKIREVFAGRTTGYRLFNGEGDRLPGLVCDIYDDVAVLQFDGEGMAEFWQKELVTNWLKESLSVQTVIDKSRMHEGIQQLEGALEEPKKEFLENDVRFIANLEKGQKTGFFFDQRDNRDYLRAWSKRKTVANLFSYTGGFSIYAGFGGAKAVTSVDIAAGALELADETWARNELPNMHESLAMDVFEFLQDDGRKWDVMIVDPPSMAHSEAQKELAIKKYSEAFSLAAKKVVSGGDLFLSSCSSHISFNDFFEITKQSLSGARRTGQILRVSGQGIDHPFPHCLPQMRYLKFLHLRLD